MVEINKMPMYTINSEVMQKEQVSFGSNLQEKLEDFAKDRLRETRIEIGYNTFEIKIFAKNLVDWDRLTHESFRRKFNAILYSIEHYEHITSTKRDFTIVYTFIPRFVKKSDNMRYSMSYSYITALFP